MVDHKRKHQVADIMHRQLKLEVSELRTRRYSMAQQLHKVQSSAAELAERITSADAKLMQWGQGHAAVDLASVEGVMLYAQEQRVAQKSLSAEERRLAQRVSQLDQRLFEAQVSEKTYRNIKGTSAKAVRLSSEIKEMEQSLDLWLLSQRRGLSA